MTQTIWQRWCKHERMVLVATQGICDIMECTRCHWQGKVYRDPPAYTPTAEALDVPDDEAGVRAASGDASGTVRECGSA